MSKRLAVWLIAIVAVGVIVWVAFGLVWGLLAAAATLVASEAVERVRRRRLRAARGETSSPSLRDHLTTRRASR